MPFFTVTMKKTIVSSVKADDKEKAKQLVLENVPIPVMTDTLEDFFDSIEVVEE